MVQESILTDELRQAIGDETQPVTFEIDKTRIQLFTSAVEDSNPLWTDEEKARHGRYGGLVAPPSLLCAVLAVGKHAWEHINHLLPPRGLDAGGEWEFFLPIRLGDTLTVVNKIADIVEKQGRLGSMILITSELTWRNQRQELVAKATSTVIRY